MNAATAPTAERPTIRCCAAFLTGKLRSHAQVEACRGVTALAESRSSFYNTL
jgi:hypothetical protein